MRNRNNTRKKSAYSKYNSKNGRNNKQQDNGNKEAIKWAIITCVIIIALAILGMSFVFGGFGASDDQMVIPSLVGENYEEMVAQYEEKGITITIAQEVEDEEFDEGVIIDQSPKAGKNKKLPFEIIVTVSSGVKEATMKDYSDIDAEKVESELVKKGYKVKIEKEEDDSVEEGKVIRTSPAHGESIKKGDTVTLYVSEGGNGEATVPNVKGETEERAKEILKENKLTVGSVGYDYSDSVEQGRVMNQSHSSGTKLEEGTAVSITISNGPAPQVTEAPTAAPTEAPVVTAEPVVDGVVAGGGMVEE